jgi:cation-transporting ATPase E
VDTPQIVGLSTEEVEARVERGEVNAAEQRASRSLSHILRANIFTRFNALLGGLLAVIIVVGPFQDALFGVVLVTNAAVGIIQELRAKRTLDRLALLAAPRARVLRDGDVREVHLDEIVLDDVLELRRGDQLVVDASVVAGELEVDESLISGEAEPVTKGEGDEVLSGSFVVSGSGLARATRVGADAYAQSLADEARRFTLVSSELRDGINQILRIVTWLILPVAGLLVSSQLRTSALADALRSSVAGVGAMVPEGLVLLTSVAFAVAALRLARGGVLVQELAAVEGLARVDVVCVDKTGTLTEGSLVVTHVERLTDGAEIDQVLGAVAAADPDPNPSLRALAAAFPPPAGWTQRTGVAFSSARKWSSVTFDEHGTWVLGAPEILLATAEAPVALERATHLARSGHRVLLLARTAAPVDESWQPTGVEPVALVALEEKIRPDAADTLEYFAAQGVAVKVISGDNPETVGAIAAAVGVAGADQPIDARTLPEDLRALGEMLDTHGVFGRVLPQQKRAMVVALQARSHVVAMTGDGVNDVLALKDADIGVAMASGSGATKAVAQLVLLNDTFASLPGVVAEGRRVIANVERVANLFVTKTVYATLLALSVGVLALPFPFLPRHLTIVSTLTIGVPGFFLALAPNHRRFRPGFVARVLRFAVPAGVVAAAATLGAYGVARAEGVSLTQSRTTALLVLFAVGLWVLVILARPLTGPRGLLALGMAAAFAFVMAVPGLRTFFDLQIPAQEVLLTACAIAAGAALVLRVAMRLVDPVERGAVSPPP